MDAPGILLVEGEDEGLERVLRKYHIDNLVARVPDRDQAFSLLRSGFAGQVQLLILDYSVCGAQSLEAVLRVRAMPGLDRLPAIVACGSPEEESQVRAWSLSRTAAMSKPAGFFKLLECIQKLEMRWFVFASKTG
jgi:CheY-like chemotaxis protein